MTNYLEILFKKNLGEFISSIKKNEETITKKINGREGGRREKSKKYVPFILLLFTITSFLLTNYYLTKDLKSIPTCLYGCDYYFENGISQNMALDIDFEKSSSHGWLNQTNSLPKGQFFLVAVFSKLTDFKGDDFWKNYIYLSYIFIILGVVFWFLLYRFFFNNDYLALLLSVLSLHLTSLPFFKYRDVINVLLPLLLFLLLKMLDEKEINYKKIIYLILSFVIGVLFTNVHAEAFFVYIFIISSLFIFYILYPINFSKNFLVDFLKKVRTWNSLILISLSFMTILVSIFLGWWKKVIFEYGGKTNAFKFDIHIDLTNVSNYFETFFNFIKNIFFNFSDIKTSLLSLIIAIVFLSLFFIKTRDKKLLELNKCLYFVTFLFFISIFNYLITAPLFGKTLSPNHSFGFLFPFFSAFIVGYFFVFIFTILGDKNRNYKKYKNIFLILLTLLLTFGLISDTFEGKSNNKFWHAGKNELNTNYQKFDDFVIGNGLQDDIFITTNELGFAIFGVSGVSLLSGRQSHFFIFGDFQKYWLDSAIILYSNNPQNRYEVLKRYDNLAKSKNKELYLYWDYYWINSEWHFDNNENYYPFDPLRFEDNLSLRKVLDDNQIKYFVRENDIFEPSGRNSPYATKLNILYISPENYNNYTHPWNDGLNDYLEEVWKYEESGQTLSRIYKINL